MARAQLVEHLIDRYDTICEMPGLREYYGQTDFLNFGYWEPDTEEQREACENLMERLLSFIPEKRGSILDVACGKGATTRYLLKYYASELVTGINISDKQLEIARSNAPGCTFLNRDATDLGLPDASFDNVICVEAAFHFQTREQFLREACRVLKPGGRIVLSDILMTSDGERRLASRSEANYLPDLHAYRQLLERTGFTDVHVVDVTRPCWEGHFRHVVNYFHRKLLERKITREVLGEYLQKSYQRVRDLEWYLLAGATKG